MTRRAWILVAAIVGIWLLFLSVLGFAALSVLGGGGGEWRERVVIEGGRRKVAVVNISGPIHGGESSPSLLDAGGAGAKDVVSQLRQAHEDDEVVAVIVRVDSPGGAVVASDEMALAVRRLRRSKPVVASMGDLAASGGYYVASQAERVVANPGTITGSIGVIMILPNLEGTAEKLGIRPTVLKADSLKDAGSPFREMSDRERQLYQRLLDEAHTQFIEAVAAGRDAEVAEIRRLADGRVYSGTQARANGLVDDLGDMDRAYDVALGLAGVERDDASLVELRAPDPFGFFPFGLRSPVEDVKRELGLGLGLQYLYVP